MRATHSFEAVTGVHGYPAGAGREPSEQGSPGRPSNDPALGQMGSDRGFGPRTKLPIDADSSPELTKRSLQSANGGAARPPAERSRRLTEETAELPLGLGAVDPILTQAPSQQPERRLSRTDRRPSRLVVRAVEKPLEWGSLCTSLTEVNGAEAHSLPLGGSSDIHDAYNLG